MCLLPAARAEFGEPNFCLLPKFSGCNRPELSSLYSLVSFSQWSSQQHGHVLQGCSHVENPQSSLKCQLFCAVLI